MKKSIRYVGLDVHADTIAVAICEGRGEGRSLGTVPNRPESVRKLVHEGNVRRVVIKQDHRTVAEFPLTVGVVGTVFAPVLAAVGALAAVLTECTIEVERAVESDKANVA